MNSISKIEYQKSKCKLIIISTIFILVFLLTNCCTFSQVKRTIKIGHKKIKVEIASTPSERQIGLMWRKHLPENEGMLFIFENPDYHSFWMKNTYIPLSIAFISEDKKVVEIRDMKPLDETSHRPLVPIKYALEMNKSWFKKNKIKVGDKLKF